MSTWSFFDQLTGHFVPGVFAGPADALPAQTPAGTAAIEGLYDRTRQRVDTATGLVVNRQLDAPPSTDMRTWQWDDAAARWVPAPTIAALRLSAAFTHAGDDGLAFIQWTRKKCALPFGVAHLYTEGHVGSIISALGVPMNQQDLSASDVCDMGLSQYL